MKRRRQVSRFNLLEEKWIAVMTDNKGSVEEVSLIELFNNAHNYLGLAGDMPTQDFAVLRLLLAVLHTVFSRFDAEGNAYPYINLDERYKQIEAVDEDDEEDYEIDLMKTWETLWKAGEFPSIIEKYLLKWKDRFYLFDDTYPFYQISEKELNEREINRKNPSAVHPKNINRTISESGNKIALFSPKYTDGKNKDKMTEAELARWLVLYQGYIGLSDKVIFGSEKYEVPNSKGWLFDIGGITLNGNNLYETLLLNFAIHHPDEKYFLSIQKPSWEYSGGEVVEKLLKRKPLYNLAELYTNWSRAIYIDPETETRENFSLNIIKLPEIEHQNQFLELMTLWRFNERGDNKDTYTPRRHRPTESFWRSFGIVFMPNKKEELKHPGIIDWFHHIQEMVGEYKITISTFGMEPDGNATSWVPVDEYDDRLKMDDYILVDIAEAGWVPRITGEVEKTKEIIEKTLGNFVREVKTIRNITNNDFTSKILQEAYYAVDRPFREWLSSLEVTHSKEEKIREWREQLQVIIIDQADRLVETAGPRDYKGIVNSRTGNYTNIAIAYNKFTYWLNQSLELKKGGSEQ